MPMPARAGAAAQAKPAAKRNPLKPKLKPKPAPPPPVAAPLPPPPPPPPPEPEPLPPPVLELAPESAPMPDPAADARMQAESASESLKPEPEAEAKPRGAKPAPRKRSLLGRIAAAIGWLLFVVALGGLAAAAYENETVMEHFPETKPVFAALGFEIPGPGDGLQIPNGAVTSRRVEIEGVPALLIEGKVTNIAQKPRAVPMLRGSLRDAGDRELQAWTFKTAALKLEPGESATFRTEVRQPPPQATGLAITFVLAQ